MRIRLNPPPIKVQWVSTGWAHGPIDSAFAGWTAVALFAAAAVATLGIWTSEPLLNWSCEALLFALAAITVKRPAPLFAVLSAWGAIQLAAGATEYRWSTLNQTLYYAALAAAASIASATLNPRRCARFLRVLSIFGTAVAILSVLAYFTSPGKILWIFTSDYPDNWGPFPSRNNFAQFLELCLPVAFYGMQNPRARWPSAVPPAILLAAGFASASRAGAIVLLLETVVAFAILGRRKLLAFALLAAAAIALAGPATLLHRFQQPDPFQYRREIFQSTVHMIAEHPWRGFGLGTYSTVYPEFALFDSGARVDHAHNDWLEWTAEGGFPLLALWLALAASTLRPAVRSLWGLGIPAVFLHAAVDYPFARLGIAVWVFVLMGALQPERTGSPTLLSNRRIP